MASYRFAEWLRGVKLLFAALTVVLLLPVLAAVLIVPMTLTAVSLLPFALAYGVMQGWLHSTNDPASRPTSRGLTPTRSRSPAFA